MKDTRDFYDRFAPAYHLIFADWKASVRRQAAALDRIIRTELGDRPHRVLDCTCGIRTQAIGLAAIGHTVHGSDISPRAIERAREEARADGVAVAFSVADARDLGYAEEFDVVVICDNSLPHLLTAADLHAAVKSMSQSVRPGGLFLCSIRDYDAIVAERPTSTPITRLGSGTEQRLSFQLWDWSDDGTVYDLEQFLGCLQDGAWSFQSWKGTYRPILRKELDDLLKREGIEPRWQFPAESEYYQPIVLGKKSESGSAVNFKSLRPPQP